MNSKKPNGTEVLEVMVDAPIQPKKEPRIKPYLKPIQFFLYTVTVCATVFLGYDAHKKDNDPNILRERITLVADRNCDGKLTSSELHNYLVERAGEKYTPLSQKCEKIHFEIKDLTEQYSYTVLKKSETGECLEAKLTISVDEARTIVLGKPNCEM